MKTIAISQHKGGGGKTKTAVDLSVAIARHHYRVLLVDMDPFANATNWLDIRHTGKGIYATIRDDVPLANVIRRTQVTGLDVAPSSASLAGLEKGFLAQSGSETRLRSRLASVTAQYDVCIVDCPRDLNALAVNAFTAAESVLLPYTAQDVLSLQGVAQIYLTVDAVRRQHNQTLTFDGVIPCVMAHQASNARDFIKTLREYFHDRGFTTAAQKEVAPGAASSLIPALNIYEAQTEQSEYYGSLAKQYIGRWGIAPIGDRAA